MKSKNKVRGNNGKIRFQWYKHCAHQLAFNEHVFILKARVKRGKIQCNEQRA